MNLIRSLMPIYSRKLPLFLAFLPFFYPLSLLKGGSDTLPEHGMEILGTLPIQHSGRVKPLDSYARIHLLMFSGKQSLGKKSAIQWLWGVISQPDYAMQEPLFEIRNPELLNALSLKGDKSHKYSFKTLIQGFQDNNAWLRTAGNKEKRDRTLVENQLVDLYEKNILFHQICQGWTLFQNNIQLNDDELSKILGISSGEMTSPFELFKRVDEMKSILSKKEDDEATQKLKNSVLLAFQQMKNFADIKDDSLWAILPPNSEEKGEKKETWDTPWHYLNHSSGHGDALPILNQLYQMVQTGSKFQGENWMTSLIELKKTVEAKSKSLPMMEKVAFEYLVNGVDPFYKSLYFYTFTFLALLIGFFYASSLFYKLAFCSYFFGSVFHLGGLMARCYIMERPPVSTLYESIIFVGIIGVLFSFFIEYSQRNGAGLFIGSLTGALLHLLGFSYLRDGDSLGMLVAVLNSNFWLATHVVTITMGYGICYLAGLLGHLYLFQRAILGYGAKQTQKIFQNMNAMALIAIFFTTLGTILGGIWADQSWGRFWGWDPKENGALLIVLWLLFVIHCRIAGLISGLGFAFGMVLLNIIVAVAWFGVNLLNVGLHSYGFTDSIANNLMLFCVAEALFGTIFTPLAFLRTYFEGSQEINSGNKIDPKAAHLGI